MTNTTSSLITIIKDNNQDFEWYPTTNEIIDALITNYQKRPETKAKRSDRESRRWKNPEPTSFLDIGAGNGKVLLAMQKAGIADKCYAIEKSIPLISMLPTEFVVVGTDFWEQSLYDKEATITFSNPPYSQFEAWAERIIQESGSETIYLVIPKRWENSVAIKAALGKRKPEVIGEFSFKNSEDRQARAIVHLIRIDNSGTLDAFDRFFNETFPEIVGNYDEFNELKKEQRKTYDPSNADLVKGEDLVTYLVALYQKEIAEVQKSYNHLCSVDVSLLIELDVTISTIKEKLICRLKELKKQYWKRVFDNLDKLTERLTSENRNHLIRKIFEHSHVDFTVQNAYAIILWAIRNANDLIDDQVLSVYGKMIETANVINYTSNHRVFVCNRWRSYDEKIENSHFYLNFRIVLEMVGGIYNGTYSWDKTRHGGLTENAYKFLSDLLTVANNLGFKVLDHVREFEWSSGTKVEFRFTDDAGKPRILFTVRAFKNQNLHIMLGNSFGISLNVEHGRLKGWVNTPHQAVNEMKETFASEDIGLLAVEKAAAVFGSNFRICSESLGNLLPTTENKE